MTAAARDVSNYDGAPIILYDFYRKSVPTLVAFASVETHWRYTSSDRDFTFDGNVYKAVPLSDNGIRQGGGTDAEQLTIVMPYDEAVPQMFVGSPPSDPIFCIIRQTHEDETDAFPAWTGQIGAVSRTTSDSDSTSIAASIICDTVGASLARTGLRLSWSRGCPHDLYGFECRNGAVGTGADPALHYVTGTITALDGEQIEASAFSGFPKLIGGFIEWFDTYGHAERLGIIGQSGAVIRVMGATDKLTVGMTVIAFRGCNHTPDHCDEFSNIENYGGHVYLPSKSPFVNEMIF